MNQATYTFGSFRLDTARRLLFSGNEITPLPERAFQLLLLLIEAAGEVVSKETLAARVWPESTVSDANLSQHVYLLRRMLREKATDRSYIMTVSRRGFRFAAPITTAAIDQTPSPIDVTKATLPVPITRANRTADPFWEYCRGSQLLERRSAPQLWSAIEAFENAIRLNDTSALPFVGLARGYSLLAELGYVPAITAFSKVRTAIGQAINLDPGSAAAHAVFSEALLFGDWDWSGARGASDHALRLDPGSTFVRQNAVRLYIGLGEYATAQTEAQHALMLDPSCPRLHVLFAQAMIHAGDYERVIPFLSDLIELEPECHIARRFRAQAYLLGGHPEKAIRDLEHLLQQADANSTEIALLSRAFAEYGDADRAREMHAKLLEMSSTEHIVGVNLALSAIGLGEEREAMQHLESAYRDREPMLVFLKGLHWFEPLRDTPAFAQMLVNIGPKTRVDRSTNASYEIESVEELLA
jgi:DNA-binding winged helix-turn-helix (wHTH) protein/cytochrome c-type biogenesis protein CcmH/NrfG